MPEAVHGPTLWPTPGPHLTLPGDWAGANCSRPSAARCLRPRPRFLPVRRATYSTDTCPPTQRDDALARARGRRRSWLFRATLPAANRCSGRPQSIAARATRSASAEDSPGRIFRASANCGRKSDLLESMLEPSRRIEPKHAAYVARMVDGSTVTGVVVKRNEAGVVLRDAQNKEIVLASARDRAAEAFAALADARRADGRPDRARSVRLARIPGEPPAVVTPRPGALRPAHASLSGIDRERTPVA